MIAYKYLLSIGGVTLDRLATDLGWGRGRAERVLGALRRMRLAITGRTDGDWVALRPDALERNSTDSPSPAGGPNPTTRPSTTSLSTTSLSTTGKPRTTANPNPAEEPGPATRPSPAKPLSSAIVAWQDQLDELRDQLDTLAVLCDDTTGDHHTPTTTVEGHVEVAAALDAAAARCRTDAIAVGGLTTGVADSLPTHVNLRVLLPHLSRYDAGTRDCVDRVTRAGAQVRTTASAIPALVLFDRAEAFLLDLDGQGCRAHRVRHPAIVDFITHTAENAWATSEVFEAAGGGNRLPEHLSREVKGSIVQLLAAGYKDEVVAKKLGIAVRTCRKYIAEVFDDLGARSRFQAGWMMRDRLTSGGHLTATAGIG
ncbi:hypothetical protein BJP25_21935 [Actinokineospora bangkokensis]|uniref:HTH luxR-type domain-containing protein n=2 Tax=Actinokineospora bangkokensis TaxID=1193682 RepID=A0A1Q9LKW3_9PSEU|nr:hypothetical protein BJP25_21935 [Actinokineospora bangkokensis]